MAFKCTKSQWAFKNLCLKIITCSSLDLTLCLLMAHLLNFQFLNHWKIFQQLLKNKLIKFYFLILLWGDSEKSFKQHLMVVDFDFISNWVLILEVRNSLAWWVNQHFKDFIWQCWPPLNVSYCFSHMIPRWLQVKCLIALYHSKVRFKESPFPNQLLEPWF